MKLLWPALIPSWRFFDVIAPSPRIEYALLKTPQDRTVHWKEFRPRPSHLSIGDMLKRLFWNAQWNETLFLVSCAERFAQNPTEHSQKEILMRIKHDLQHQIDGFHFIQFRLAFISRDGAALNKDIIYTSPTYQLEGNTRP